MSHCIRLTLGIFCGEIFMHNRTHFHESVYRFFMHWTTFGTNVRLIPINFNKPWWMVIWKQKYSLIANLSCDTVDNVFKTLLPMLIGSAIAAGNYTSFAYLIIGWMLSFAIAALGFVAGSKLQAQTIYSIAYAAHRKLLRVDPIFHTSRRTGKILGKIDQAAYSYQEFLDIALFELFPMLASVVTVTIALSRIDLYLGLTGLIMLLGVGALSVICTLFVLTVFEKPQIRAYDELRAMSTENLNQINLVRSSFASDEVDKILQEKNLKVVATERTAWVAFVLGRLFIKLVYGATLFILGLKLVACIKAGTLSPLIGATLIMTYIRGSYDMVSMGRMIFYFVKSLNRIKELFVFMRAFGEQSYPVLETDDSQHINTHEERAKNTHIDIVLKDISFGYEPGQLIFNNNNLSLSVPYAQENKLFGVIGKSGAGKTTIASILGGQIKPTQGKVLVNGIDIYGIDDQTRRQLIALQGQVASSIRGTLQQNILFGLPALNNIYRDEELIAVLTSVGLWDLFKDKKGLETNVSEGGMSLSGGQRQRLNFAGLYLRAKYFKPALIIIDEPTSSLDESSEQSITQMINELAQQAVTIVVAHRIKTLHDAVGILDFSTIHPQQTLTFLSPEVCMRESTYYQNLVNGQAELE